MNLNGIKLTWLGHATFRIETSGGKTILIDPWVMGNPMCPEKEKNVKKVDVMLCTHGHFDHIGDAVEIAKKHNPKVVGIPELCGWLGKKGVKQTAEMNKGGTQTVDDIKVTMVHADHSCGIKDGDEVVYGGEACGYVVEFANGVKIYHAGDTNVFGDMQIVIVVGRPERVDFRGQLEFAERGKIERHIRMALNGRLRSVVLLRTSTGAPGGSDAGSRDVGDLRSHNRSMAGDRGQCAGIFGGGLDGPQEPRYAAGLSPRTSLDAPAREVAAPESP